MKYLFQKTTNRFIHLLLKNSILKKTNSLKPKVCLLKTKMHQPTQCGEEQGPDFKMNLLKDMEATKIQNDKEDAIIFDSVFKTICDDLLSKTYFPSELEDASKWFKRVLDYNIPHGKRNRGLAVLSTLRHLKNGSVSKEELTLASVLGWCIELLQAFFLISDDIMDNSITRRGQPCWYKLHDVGMIALNDAFYVESSIYQLLKKYTSSKPYYLQLIELFHETTSQTISGQALDLLTAPVGKLNLEKFNQVHYEAIVKYKTAFYSFYLPVACALYMNGISDANLLNDAKVILLKIGEYFQIQDDYLDCYGNPQVTGKIGTDIEDNKCSWLVVQAIQKANPQQMQVLKDNYACHDSQKVVKVKQLFAELNLVEAYKKYEEESFYNLSCLINNLSNYAIQQALLDILNRIYKREK